MEYEKFHKRLRRLIEINTFPAILQALNFEIFRGSSIPDLPRQLMPKSLALPIQNMLRGPFKPKPTCSLAMWLNCHKSGSARVLVYGTLGDSILGIRYFNAKIWYF